MLLKVKFELRRTGRREQVFTLDNPDMPIQTTNGEVRYLAWLHQQLKRFPQEREAEILWHKGKVSLVAHCFYPKQEGER